MIVIVYSCSLCMINFVEDTTDCRMDYCKSENCYIDKDTEWDSTSDVDGYTCLMNEYYQTWYY